MLRTRSLVSTILRSSALLLGGACLSGCEPAIREEFRTAAFSSVQTGVSSILQGVVDGLFAVAEPEPSGTSTGGGTDTGGGDTGGGTTGDTSAP